MNKRGISPLIATVLIIGFTIIIAVVVMTWGLDIYNNYKEKTTEESSVALKCSNLDFSIREACIFGDNVDVSLENTGQEDISGFLYRVKSDAGLDVNEDSNKLGLYSRSLLNLPFKVLELGQPNEIEIYPKVNIDGNDFICSYSRKKDIKNCFSLLNFNQAVSLVPDGQTDPIGMVISKDDFYNTKNQVTLLSGFDLINKIPEANYLLVSAGTNYSVYSKPFTIPNKEEITRIGIYGETNPSNIKLILVGSSDNFVKDIYPLPGLGSQYYDINDHITFQYRIPIDNDMKGKELRLKIDYSDLLEGQVAYLILYRFCYTDAYSGCIV
ncbi:MAG: hypothetical protein KJ623_02435 [Nanoarchaeota archaeon]|nr:hypothetical protein [Nanoarchaeota archaeon]MBU0962317.1 hypothetical protein [Nanoarchaeota archaeon]